MARLSWAAVALVLATNMAGGFDVPKWPATYAMNQSTIIMPCSDNNFTTDPVIDRFGLRSIDWSNTKAQWVNTHPMSCEENLVKQAAMMKAANPRGRAYVYRNLVLAMPWFTTVRKIMDDQRQAHDRPRSSSIV